LNVFQILLVEGTAVSQQYKKYKHLNKVYCCISYCYYQNLVSSFGSLR